MSTKSSLALALSAVTSLAAAEDLNDLSSIEDVSSVLASGVKLPDGPYRLGRAVLEAIASEPGLIESGEFLTLGLADPFSRALGLEPGDFIVSIGRLPAGRFPAKALAAQRGKKKFAIEIERRGEKMTLHYRVVANTALREKVERVIAEWKQLHRNIGDGIRQLGEDLFEVDRKILDDLLRQPALIAPNARIVPAIRDGRPIGFKIYAIRPGSAYARLGLKNGDTVLQVNETALTTPDIALLAFEKLESANAIRLKLSREGKEVMLEYRITGDR